MIKTIWRAAQNVDKSAFAKSFAEWIFCSGSFMEHLRQQGIAHPRIHVLSQGWGLPLPMERQELGLDFRTYALVREVLISGGENQQFMYARSIFPRLTLTGAHSQLGRLKSKPLGEVLFKDKSMERSPFELAELKSGMFLYEKAEACAGILAENLWARRSVFKLHHKTLLLTEVFLPAILKL